MKVRNYVDENNTGFNPGVPGPGRAGDGTQAVVPGDRSDKWQGSIAREFTCHPILVIRPVDFSVQDTNLNENFHVSLINEKLYPYSSHHFGPCQLAPLTSTTATGKV